MMTCAQCAEHFADEGHRRAIFESIDLIAVGAGKAWLEAFLRFVVTVHGFHVTSIEVTA